MYFVVNTKYCIYVKLKSLFMDFSIKMICVDKDLRNYYMITHITPDDMLLIIGLMAGLLKSGM